jgi:uncharacterized surface protein with fasciclin (FAS1) repeats
MKTLYNYLMVTVGALIFTFLFICCDPDLLKFSDSHKGSAWSTSDNTSPIAIVLSTQEDYSEWVHILEYSNMYSALNQSGVKFTAFVPNNTAVKAFYNRMNVSGIEALGTAYAKTLVKYHTYFGDSLKLSEKFPQSSDVYSISNITGDKLDLSIDSEVGGYHISYIDQNTVSKNWDTKMAHLDVNRIHASNGFIYGMQTVMNPLIETIYDRVAKNPSCTIMKSILDESKWDDTLKVVADTIVSSGSLIITKRAYTFFNVSDVGFAKADIHNLSDFKSKLQATSPNTNLDLLINQYVQYHMMNGNHLVSDLKTMTGIDTIRIWSTLASNQIFTVSLDTTKSAYYINFADTSDFTKIPATFVYDNCNGNVLAKNGYVLELDSWLPVYSPKQSTVVWDLADFTEVKRLCGENYAPKYPAPSAEYIAQYMDLLTCYTTVKSLSGVKSPYSAVEYHTCKSNLQDCLNYDRVIFNVGYTGSVTMRTPVLVRGKYKVSIDIAYLTGQNAIRQMLSGSNGGLMSISMDNGNMKNVAPYTTLTVNKNQVAKNIMLWDELQFDTTSSHIFKFVVMDPAASSSTSFYLQFDCITFTPIVVNN